MDTLKKHTIIFHNKVIVEINYTINKYIIIQVISIKYLIVFLQYFCFDKHNNHD